MPRNNKKSRIKGLPARVQLQQKDATTGSYPSRVRIASDNRTGKYNVSYDDVKTINFGFVSKSMSTDGVHIPLGLPTNSPFITVPTEQTTSITLSSYVVKGIGDGAAKFTPGQSLEPFKEVDLPALDGLSSTGSFYSTGIPVTIGGSGFEQPLWSKTKIEINLPVAGGTNSISMAVSGGHATTVDGDPDDGPIEKSVGVPVGSTGDGLTGISYPMSYYNFDINRWEGIGRGEALCYTGQYSTRDGGENSVHHFKTTTIGFTQGLVTQREALSDTGISGVFEYMAGAGQPTTKFGFPFDARYHATSSQLLSMSDFISEPFLVEKIVISLSGAFEFSSTNFTTSTIAGPTITNIVSAALPACINNFFILNQRKPYAYNIDMNLVTIDYSDLLREPKLESFYTLPKTIKLTREGNPTFINTIRDIVTFGGISSFASNMETTASRQDGEDVGNFMVTNAAAASENPKELFTRDFIFESNEAMINDLTPLNWSGTVKLELESRNPTRVFPLFGQTEYKNNVKPAFLAYDNSTTSNRINDSGTGGGRNGLGISYPSGRDLNSPIATIEIDSTSFDGIANKKISLMRPEAHYRTGGYVLFPEDKLIFGWQQPTPLSLTVDASSRHVDDGLWSTMTFKDAKVTLFGSPIREGKEYHDTLNQILSSESVHEVIE